MKVRPLMGRRIRIGKRPHGNQASQLYSIGCTENDFRAVNPS